MRQVHATAQISTMVVVNSQQAHKSISNTSTSPPTLQPEIKMYDGTEANASRVLQN
jgi:hypothetical protein